MQGFFFVLMMAAMLGISPGTTFAQSREIPKISPAQLEDLIANNKGKVVIVDFFATWCTPCRQEIPGFVALQDKYGARGLFIIGVSVDEGPAQVVENFARETGINYALYHASADISRKYKIRAIPTTYVYDKNGNKVKTHIGFVSQEDFDKQISELLQ